MLFASYTRKTKKTKSTGKLSSCGNEATHSTPPLAWAPMNWVEDTMWAADPNNTPLSYTRPSRQDIRGIDVHLDSTPISFDREGEEKQNTNKFKAQPVPL